MKKHQRLVVAVSLGMLASGLLYVNLNKSSERAEAKVPSGSLVVATARIPANARITPAQIAVEQRPAAYIPAGAAKTTVEVVGRVTRTEIFAGEALLSEKLFPEGQEAHELLPVPDGKRAVSVAVDEVVGVAGFVQPGSLVDVVGTFDIDGTPVSKVVLQNILVLAIAQDPSKKEEARASLVSSATLAVLPHEAEILTLATDRGKIRLAMRAERETKSVRTGGISPQQLTGRVPATVPAAAAPTAPANARPVYTAKPPQAPAPAASVAPDAGIVIFRGSATEHIYR